MRQDLTVQRIQNDFSVKVSQTHSSQISERRLLTKSFYFGLSGL